MKMKIVLADDHQMFRHALRALLEKEANLQIVGEAADGEALLMLAAELSIDLVCMDIGMPGMNGIEATRRLLAIQPEAKVIGLSAFSEGHFISDLLAAGAHGYVTKAAAADELLRAIAAVGQGRIYLSPELDADIRPVAHHADAQSSSTRQLSARERQVLQLIVEGHTSARIAKQLHIAVSTVEVHRRNLMRKLGLHSVAELTRYAIRSGICQPLE